MLEPELTPEQHEELAAANGVDLKTADAPTAKAEVGG